MSIQNILLLAALGLLLIVCFFSNRIAEWFGKTDEKQLAKRSLLIKLGAAAAALIIYVATFAF